MAFLGKGKKQYKLQLAEELGINATLNMTVPSIKIAITNSEGYEEEFVKNLYETIIANGKRLEELERAEKMRSGELERAEKIRLEKLVKEQVLKEKELQLKFDLERSKIESGIRGSREKKKRFGKTSPGLGASVLESTRQRTFKKRVIQRCYHCNMPGHIIAVCPKLMKNKTTESLNNIERNENPDFLNSYITKGSGNGHEIDILRDTGATIDLVCAKYLNPSFFSGENVWVKQPLGQELVCLPLADVEISGDFGAVFGILVRHSSVYHPQSNPVERFHRALKRLLRAFCLDAGSEWDKHLPSILLALRTVSHESTGNTPSELVYGKNLRTPETLVMEHWMEPEEESDLVTEYMFKLINRFKRCQEVTINKMEEMQVKRKIWYDKNSVKREIKDGDLVLVLAISRANKLAVQWIGLATILNKISETNYLVEIPDRRETSQIYHINMLKPYYKRPEHVNVSINDETQNSLADQELEIPYLENNSLVYDFEDVIQASELNKYLHDKQMDLMRELLNKYSKCFSNNPGLTNLVEHEIQLVSNQPVRTKLYRMSHRQNEILTNEINRMLKLGIIEVGESDYMSPMILVEVAGKEPRPCIDYRKLNFRISKNA
ncbi:transposon Ty3-G Gag-Pol polyprotein [Trichonephila clavipes]|nr:transposon Ty3-G Gag-Pol polyprotein [Trichonephila clavipes]